MAPRPGAANAAIARNQSAFRFVRARCRNARRVYRRWRGVDDDSAAGVGLRHPSGDGGRHGPSLRGHHQYRRKRGSRLSPLGRVADHAAPGLRKLACGRALVAIARPSRLGFADGRRVHHHDAGLCAVDDRRGVDISKVAASASDAPARRRERADDRDPHDRSGRSYRRARDDFLGRGRRDRRDRSDNALSGDSRSCASSAPTSPTPCR